MTYKRFAVKCDGVNQIKSLNRGSSAFTESWNYDGTGNWLQYNRTGAATENRTYNKANEIASVCTHDRNGNMTVLPGLKGKYDGWNRLVEILDTSDSLLATYFYNGLNQRVKKTVGGVTTTSFFNERWQELESITSGVTTSYIWGQRYIDDLVLREKGAEKLYALHDPNWNVVATCDSTGTVQERMCYDAFGKVSWFDAAFASKGASTYDWNRTFTGQVFDGETSLMLYRNRYHHAGLGRFMQRDPIGYAGKDENLYRYVGNVSIHGLDPYGHNKFTDPWTKAKKGTCKENCQVAFDNCLKYSNRWFAITKRWQCQPILDHCLEYCNNRDKAVDSHSPPKNNLAEVGTAGLVGTMAGVAVTAKKYPQVAKIGGAVGGISSVVLILDGQGTILSMGQRLRKSFAVSPETFDSVRRRSGHDCPLGKGQEGGDECNGSWETEKSVQEILSNEARRVDWFLECGTNTVHYVVLHGAGKMSHNQIQDNQHCSSTTDCLTSDVLMRIISEVYTNL